MLSDDKGRESTGVRVRTTVLAGIALAVGLSACSNTGAKQSAAPHRSTTSTSVAASPAETASRLRVDADKDNDTSASDASNDNQAALSFGRPASPAERRSITALVDRYYRAALDEDGASACSMLYSTLAEAMAEDYGSLAGPQYMRGNSCPEILTKQFRHFHSLLATEVPKLRLERVRLEEHHGRAILAFGHLPEREIQVAREGPIWRINAVLDGELP